MIAGVIGAHVALVEGQAGAQPGEGKRVARQEHERGAIAPGLRADFVVLEGRLDPHEPPTVAETWVAGEQVYVANGDG